jgi:hypothetical protein
MLRPLLASVLVRCSSRFCVTETGRRPCSTLGDIRECIAAMREKEKLTGGVVQLCITEDMQIFVEHREASSHSERRVVSLDKTFQGSPSTTVAAALRSLSSSCASTAALSGPAAASSSSLLPLRQSFTSESTVIDLTRVAAEDARSLLLHVENTYPALKLLVRHTKGKDLQGTKMHTVQVELVPRAEKGGLSQLSSDMQRLVDTFKGEGVGEGFNGCVRRAVREAFESAQLPLPKLSSTSDDASTLLSLYVQTWVQDGYQLFLTVLPGNSRNVECTVRHPSHGHVLGTTTLPLTAIGLRDMLVFCDRVAASYKPERYAAVQQRLQRSPLHLVLPRDNLRVKRLLRRLLFYYYGISDDDIAFVAAVKPGSVYAAEITVRLPPPYSTAHSGATPLPPFLVASAHGTGSKRALELAAVHAMETLFPDVFAKQVAYHPTIREIQQCDTASVTANVPPQVVRGFEAQLRWAVQTIHADFVVESVLLKQCTPYPLWGVSTGSSIAWLSQLFLLRPASSSEADAGSGVVRELCAHAFDNRRSRSEHKVIAAALAKHFPVLCKASVEDAKKRKLIDSNGAPTPFEGVQPLQGSETECCAAALSSDPCLTTLTPSRSSVLQPLSGGGDVRNSALECFWMSLTSSTSAGQQLMLRVQRSADIAMPGGGAGGRCGVYAAKCVTVMDGAEEMERLVSEAAATTEIGALFAVLEAAQQTSLPNLLPYTTVRGTEERVQAESAITANVVDEKVRKAVTFLTDIPTTLPTSTPVQTCTQAIGLLYGLHCSARVTQEGAQYVGELWGSFPVDSAVLKHHDHVSANPFTLDRIFFLGRGQAESPFMAVVRAAQHAFEQHVRVHQRVFHNPVIEGGVLHLQPMKGSRLADLCDAVLNEIKATSDKALTDHTLTLRFQKRALFELAFTVSSGTQAIKLEEAVSRRLLDCAREFSIRVSTETGMVFVTPAALATLTFHTPVQLLRQLCEIIYGMTLHEDVVKVHKEWHCRLSARLTGELACCVAESSAARKRTAIDAAAASVLKRYFADEVAHIPSYAAVCPTQGGDAKAAEEAMAQTELEDFIFQLSDATDDAPPGS